MTEVQARRGRRADRAELPEGWAGRTRKRATNDGLGLKLPIPDDVYQKYPKTLFRHRWIRAEKSRMYAKTKVGDWEPVEGVDPVPGAADQHGNAVEHVLCVTRRDWWEEDRAKREDRRKEIEAQFRRGKVTGQGDDASGAGLSPEISYAEPSNRLS